MVASHVPAAGGCPDCGVRRTVPLRDGSDRVHRVRSAVPGGWSAVTRQPPEDNDNADWGRTAETAACERWPLERVSGDTDDPWWHDARATGTITDTDGFGDVEVGTPIEVKSALWRIDANGGERRCCRDDFAG